MARIRVSTALTALILGAGPACAQMQPMPVEMPPLVRQGPIDGSDNFNSLKSECGKPNLDEAVVDACLERARVLDETTPSPDLESLTAQLQQRADQAFNPNGVDQTAPSARAARLVDPNPKTVDIPIVRNDDPPPAMLQPQDGETMPQQAALPPDVDPSDVAPVEDKTNEDDGPPPEVITDDLKPPDNPNRTDDDPQH